MTWDGVRYYVDPVPQALGRAEGPSDDHRPAACAAGWRFRATSIDGESHRFDVRERGLARWNLTAVQD
jgi:hypothetical protein